jgi:ATP-binding cassette subfamily C protein CydD
LFMNLDRRLLNKAASTRLLLFLVVLLGLAGGLLIIAQAGSLSQVINDVFLARQTLSQVAPLLWGLLIIILARAVLTVLSEGLAATSAIRIKTTLREELFRRLFELGPAYLQGQTSGDMVTRAIQGIENLEGYFSQYLPQMVLAAVIPLSILVFVFPLDTLSGIVLLVTAPLIPLFMVLIGNTAESLTRRQFTALSRLSAVFLDTLQGLATLKALNQSQARIEKIRSASDRYRIATLKVLRITFLSSLVLELVAAVSTAVVAVEIGLRLLYGQLAFQPAFFILVIAPEFYLPLRQLGLRFHAGAAGVSAARAIFEILETPLVHNSLVPAANPEPPLTPATSRSNDLFERPFPASRSIPYQISHPPQINFQKISYLYPTRVQEALTGVTFTANPNQVTALVGASGSGKSTIIQLLLRFIEPQSGQISLDGQSLRSIDLYAWRSLVAWVPQQPYLFQGTLADNLRLGDPSATIEQVRQAARLAELDEFVQSLPMGYDTIVGERAVKLSGGQAQRLALGRGFLKDAPILLLDEPAAHLDPDLESRIDSAVRRLCQGRTVILIAHGLRSVENADRIVVMDRGSVIESGSHSDLLARQGAYARLHARRDWNL